MKKKKNKDLLPTGWDKEDDSQEIKKDNNYSNNFSSKHIVKNKKKQNLLEKIIKSIIYGILFITIPRYIKSSKTKGREIVNSAYTKINSLEFAFAPAGYAMYLFLSFIPTIGLVIGIIGSINQEFEFVIKVIILGQLVPGIDKVIPAFSEVWSNAGGATTFIIVAISVLWLSSKGYSKFILSLDALYEHKTQNAAWQTRIKGFITSIIITSALIIFLLIISAFLAFILNNVFGIKITKDIVLKDLPWEFQLIFWLPTIFFLPFAICLGFLLAFKFAPSFRIKFSQITPGAFVAAIPTALYILIFGSLTSLINYKQFGVVASFMYIILLLSVMSYFIYIGIIVNSSFYKTFINLPTIGKGGWLNKK
ncbi:YihY/virulence factor BrkB family protein [Metamycoplasma alkalescens]|uniref:Uncharacterized protein n=2 Tax=Metamycoplasma alkalescens TaxID=45363 RepID=N9SQV1_9BACT|nr:YhjD/YihY/BrkB family envelope integrity protein [Metamycoplasma alkalescens]ENY53739.1 Hypothetical protein, putative ribonuclease [Metamycoplasma alkalescens 14918]PYF42543.1 membrane protein [Metamycoplasma alkalescens]